MEKKFDVIALGELLIDFTNNGTSEQGNTLFEANPGGAPCNVLSMLSKFGHKTAFIGKVGEDMFGALLKKTLEELCIDTTNLQLDKTTKTTLAFVHTMKGGDRDFSFYRNPGADMMLTEEELNEYMLVNTKIFHFGTISMTHEKVCAATKRAIYLAKKHGALISFDPNLRERLWSSLDDAKRQTHYGISQCDVLKISDNEIRWFTGEEDFTKGIRKVQNEFKIPLILLSMGKDGSRVYYKDTIVEEEAFLQENTIDTTGAGDTFTGCCLHYILKNGLDYLNETQLKEMLTNANAAASIITTRKGALRVMPETSEIKEFLKYNS